MAQRASSDAGGASQRDESQGPDLHAFNNLNRLHCVAQAPTHHRHKPHTLDGIEVLSQARTNHVGQRKVVSMCDTPEPVSVCADSPYELKDGTVAKEVIHETEELLARAKSAGRNWHNVRDEKGRDLVTAMLMEEEDAQEQLLLNRLRAKSERRRKSWATPALQREDSGILSQVLSNASSGASVGMLGRLMSTQLQQADSVTADTLPGSPRTSSQFPTDAHTNTSHTKGSGLSAQSSKESVARSKSCAQLSAVSGSSHKTVPRRKSMLQPHYAVVTEEEDGAECGSGMLTSMGSMRRSSSGLFPSLSNGSAAHRAHKGVITSTANSFVMELAGLAPQSSHVSASAHSNVSASGSPAAAATPRASMGGTITTSGYAAACGSLSPTKLDSLHDKLLNSVKAPMMRASLPGSVMSGATSGCSDSTVVPSPGQALNAGFFSMRQRRGDRAGTDGGADAFDASALSVSRDVSPVRHARALRPSLAGSDRRRGSVSFAATGEEAGTGSARPSMSGSTMLLHGGGRMPMPPVGPRAAGVDPYLVRDLLSSVPVSTLPRIGSNTSLASTCTSFER